MYMQNTNCLLKHIVVIQNIDIGHVYYWLLSYTLILIGLIGHVELKQYSVILMSQRLTLHTTIQSNVHTGLYLSVCTAAGVTACLPTGPEVCVCVLCAHRCV